MVRGSSVRPKMTDKIMITTFPLTLFNRLPKKSEKLSRKKFNAGFLEVKYLSQK
jgi:hypothetical protein